MRESIAPGPSGTLLPTVRLLKDPLAYYRSLFERFGDPVRIRAINGTILLTASEEGAQQILKAPPQSYAPFATQALEPLVGSHSLLTLTGSEHRRQRKLVMPSFHGQRMRSYAATMIACAQRATSDTKVGDRIVALEVSGRIALEVIIRAVFGIEEPDRIAAVSDAIGKTTRALKPVFLFSPKLQVAPFGLGPWATFEKASRALDALLYAQIARTRENPGGEDILSMLVEARDDNGEAMSDAELRDELLTLLVAGHETTSVGMAWALYHLHREPDALRAFRSEIDGRAPEDAEIPRLPYVRATVQESLRMFPIIPDFIRELTAPVEVLGYTAHPGECVGVASIVMHHDPRVYDDPMRFRPERFVGSNPPKWAYFPFGGGHRRCVGAAFAEFEIASVLAFLLSQFEFDLEEPEALYPVRRNITMAPPTGVRLRVTARR